LPDADLGGGQHEAPLVRRDPQFLRRCERMLDISMKDQNAAPARTTAVLPDRHDSVVQLPHRPRQRNRWRGYTVATTISTPDRNNEQTDDRNVARLVEHGLRRPGANDPSGQVGSTFGPDERRPVVVHATSRSENPSSHPTMAGGEGGRRIFGSRVA